VGMARGINPPSSPDKSRFYHATNSRPHAAHARRCRRRLCGWIVERPQRVRPRARRCRFPAIRILPALRRPVSVQHGDTAVLCPQSARLLRYPPLPPLRNQPLCDAAASVRTRRIPRTGRFFGRPQPDLPRPNEQPVHLQHLRQRIVRKNRNRVREFRLDRRNSGGQTNIPTWQGSNEPVRRRGNTFRIALVT